MNNLNQLSIASNQVSDLKPLTVLQQLFSLDISYNQITDIYAFGAFKNIDELGISGNPITGFISPTHFIEKYQRLLSIPLNYQKATEAIKIIYSSIGLNPPQVIFGSNYEAWFRESITFLDF